MSGFPRRWLELREAADHRSRHDFSAALRAPAQRHWSIVDLGCGTGSNLRYLRGRIAALHEGATQTWTCIDNDEQLLEALLRDSVGIRNADLSEDIAGLLASAFDTADALGSRLVTASALLDLVSAQWIDALTFACRTLQASAWFALSYDGRVTLDPVDTDDALLSMLINAHQESDKGFGPALGPQAHAYACETFREAGFTIYETPSDWLLGADDAALIEPLIEGWLAAAREQAGEPTLLSNWETRRRSQLAARRLRLRVGHCDLLALPNGRPS